MLLPPPLFPSVAEASARRIALSAVHPRGTRHQFYLPPLLHPLSDYHTTTILDLLCDVLSPFLIGSSRKKQYRSRRRLSPSRSAVIRVITGSVPEEWRGVCFASLHLGDSGYLLFHCRLRIMTTPTNSASTYCQDEIPSSKLLDGHSSPWAGDCRCFDLTHSKNVQATGPRSCTSAFSTFSGIPQLLGSLSKERLSHQCSVKSHDHRHLSGKER
jgi:hypothetical protein